MGAEDAIRNLYAAVDRDDPVGIGALLTPDVFALPASTAGAIDGPEAVIAALRGLRIRSMEMISGVSGSGRGAWVFDQVEAEALRHGSPTETVPVRVTALLDEDRDAGWRIRAAHWSIPMPSNAKQQELRAAGKLPEGIPLAESLPPEAVPLSERLRDALAGNAPLPELYSVRDDAVTIGSVTDEIFRGPAGKEAWEKFMSLEPRLKERGGMRGGLTPDGSAAWLAAHIDIIFSLVAPYRFFYVWVPEDGDWRIVLSHDSVSNCPRVG